MVKQIMFHYVSCTIASALFMLCKFWPMTSQNKDRYAKTMAIFYKRQINIKHDYIKKRSIFASYSVMVMSLTKVRTLSRKVCGSFLGKFFELSNVPLSLTLIFAVTVGG